MFAIKNQNSGELFSPESGSVNNWIEGNYKYGMEWNATQTTIYSYVHVNTNSQNHDLVFNLIRN